MDKHQREQERRKQKSLERLGSNDPSCVICGESDPHCLERHHIAGRRYCDDLVDVCRNCHRKLSDMQKDHPKQTAAPPDPLECIGHFLLGLADFLVLLIEKLRQFGNDLIAKAAKPSTGKVRS